MNKQSKKNQKGFSAIEVLISLGMAGIIITAIGSSLSSIHKLNTASAVKEKALAYAKQSMEIISELENNNFTTNQSSLNASLNSYALESPYTRIITPDPICRDANGNILITCGAQNPDGKTVKITVTINWNGEQKANLSTIFTNWRNQ